PRAGTPAPPPAQRGRARTEAPTGRATHSPCPCARPIGTLSPNAAHRPPRADARALPDRLLVPLARAADHAAPAARPAHAPRPAVRLPPQRRRGRDARPTAADALRRRKLRPR